MKPAVSEVTSEEDTCSGSEEIIINSKMESMVSFLGLGAKNLS